MSTNDELRFVGLDEDADAIEWGLAASKPEPQAQAAEPEVVGYVDEFGNVYPKAAKRGPSWVNEHQKGWKELIALQSHREAMAAETAACSKVISIITAKKDAALKACVEALRVSHEQMKLYMLNYRPGWNAYDANEDAITQAQEARK